MKSFDEQNIKVMFEDNEELKDASLLEIQPIDSINEFLD